MIRINLLSAREAEDEAGRRRDERIVVVGAVALVAVLLGAELTSRLRLVPIRAQSERLTKEVAALEEKTKELNALEAQRGELEEKLKTIAQLEARKVGPVQVLANLSDAAPEELWLLEFTESGGLGTVSGLALDNQTIAAFMRNLGSSAYFSNVDLVETTQSEQDGVPLKRFIINARLSYTGKPLPPAPTGLKFPEAIQTAARAADRPKGESHMNNIMERFFELESRERTLICAAVVILTLGGYWNFVYSGRAPRSPRPRPRSSSCGTSVTASRSWSPISTLQRERVRELGAQLLLAEARLPDQKEIPDLLSTVSSAGRESGLEILLFRQKAERFQDFYAEVPVEVLVRGNYHQVATFFDRVGKLDRIVNVADISMKTPNSECGTMIVDTACSAVTFRFLDEAERERIAKEKAEQAKKTGAKG